MLSAGKRTRLLDGVVIPAHPLALRADRTLDEERQRGLSRYYLEAGAGGLAVGVHTTQFAIREHGLYEPVLRFAAEEVARAAGGPGISEPARRRVDGDDAERPLAAPGVPAPAEHAGAEDARRALLVAGVLGPTERAVAEARVAAGLGYDLALVALAGWGDAPEADILDGVARIGEVLPVFGFYMQPALGRRRFGYEFWRAFAALEAVAAIKVAPFDRYATLDVVRGVVDAGRAGDVALYTGNDDNIVADLLTPFRVGGTTVHIVGGLLGQWAVWTRAAVELHRDVRAVVRAGAPVPLELLTRAAELTDANGAVFDVANGFAGCIAGVNEVLAREGRMAGSWCLDGEVLSAGQGAEISRVISMYPGVTGSADTAGAASAADTAGAAGAATRHAASARQGRGRP